MRILVTGGAGYIGSVSVEAFVAAGHEVTVVDDLSTGHGAAVDPGARLEVERYGETAALAMLLERREIEAVLHCGAKSVVPESMADPALYYRENVAGGIGLLEAMRLVGVRRLVLSSSAAVYGAAASPIDEDAPLAPLSPYGETKRTLEAAIAWYGRAYGLRSVILRYFNAAGASPACGEWHSPETHLIGALLAAVAAGRELVLFGADYPTPDGTCIRDYLSVVDLAAAHLAALEATDPADPRTGPPEGPCSPLVCNLGGGRGFSNREIVAAAGAVVGAPVAVRVGPRRPGDPAVLVASTERAGRVLGWRPVHGSLEELIGSAWAWRRSHPDGYPPYPA